MTPDDSHDTVASEQRGVSLPDLKAQADRIVETGGARVQEMTLDGGRFWLKRLKQRNFWLRVRKGDARTLLETERRNVETMHARGLPVPEIVLSEPDYFVLRDGGPAVDQLLRDARDAPEKHDLVRSAAQALAKLHADGAAHGGAHLRNICISDGVVTFIDLEGATPLGASQAQQAYDLRLLVFSIFAVLPADPALAQTACDAYADRNGRPILDAARDWCHRHRYLPRLVAPLRWHENRFRPDRTYRQYSAVEPTIAFFCAEQR